MKILLKIFWLLVGAGALLALFARMADCLYEKLGKRYVILEEQE